MTDIESMASKAKSRRTAQRKADPYKKAPRKDKEGNEYVTYYFQPRK